MVEHQRARAPVWHSLGSAAVSPPSCRSVLVQSETPLLHTVLASPSLDSRLRHNEATLHALLVLSARLVRHKVRSSCRCRNRN
jgi:hypothetical protein